MKVKHNDSNISEKLSLSAILTLTAGCVNVIPFRNEVEPTLLAYLRGCCYEFHASFGVGFLAHAVYESQSTQPVNCGTTGSTNSRMI